jgi:hypothetical protein
MSRGDRGYPIVPHEDVEKVDCCGYLFAATRGDQADIKCNECGAVVCTVPVERAPDALMGLASGDICFDRCPHCDALNVFLGFASVEAYLCCECGKGVVIDRPVQWHCLIV